MNEALASEASLAMLADDVAWIIDALLSVSVADEPTGILSLAMYGHAARIVYEGDRYLKSRGLHDLGTGHRTPPHGFHSALARARHATKLLEDNRKSLDDFKMEIAAHQQLHHASLTRRLHPWLHSVAPDLGLYRLDGRVVVATIPLQLRLGLGELALGEELAQALHARAAEMGRRLVALAGRLDLELMTDYPAILPWPKSIAASDHDSHRFLRRRYSRDLDEPSKLLALMIEAEATTTADLLPPTAADHKFACFRASLISVVHVLRSLAALLDDNSLAATAHVKVLRAFMSADVAQGLLSREVQLVRNTVMHYGIAPSTHLGERAQMQEIVGAIQSRFAYTELDSMTAAAARTASELLSTWRERR